MKPYIEKAIKEFEEVPELEYTARLLRTIKIKFSNEKDFIAAVNDKNELFINDKWMSKQKQEVCNFILYHECLHLFLEHIERCGSHVPYLWNIANDLCINEGIKNNYFTEATFFEMPDVGVCMEAVFKKESDLQEFKEFIGYDGEEVTKHICSETIYKFLLKVGMENLNSLQTDLIGTDDTDSESENEDEISEVEKQIITAILEEARDNELPLIEEIKNEDGNNRRKGFGGDGKAKISGIVKSKVRPVWLDKIYYTIKRIGNCKQIESYERPNRRNYILQNYSKTRATLPVYKRKYELPTIDIHIDSSGSVSDYQLIKIIGEIEAAVHLLKFEQINIFFFSSIFYNTGIQIKRKESLDLNEYTFPGRGGTDLDNTFKQYNTGALKSPDIMIFITDGMFSQVKRCSNVKCKKVFWVIEDNPKFSPPYWLKNNEVIHVRKRS